MEFSPELVLRNFSEHEKGQKKIDECIPKNLKVNKFYDFLKNGQRAYWLEGEQPLKEKSEDEKISNPIASIIILEATHFIENKKIYTKGKYKVVKLINKDEIYFNACEPIKNS